MELINVDSIMVHGSFSLVVAGSLIMLSLLAVGGLIAASVNKDVSQDDE